MKKFIVLSSLLGLIAVHGYGQTEGATKMRDTIKPKTHFKVHKEFDEQGNLIRLDSTYSYFYSNTEIDPAKLQEFMQGFGAIQHFGDLDSLFNFGSFGPPSNFGDFFNGSFGMSQFDPKFFQEFFKKFDSMHRVPPATKALPMR